MHMWRSSSALPYRAFIRVSYQIMCIPLKERKIGSTPAYSWSLLTSYQHISWLLVQDANFDCSSTGFALQAMDSSHVSLIHMQV